MMYVEDVSWIGVDANINMNIVCDGCTLETCLLVRLPFVSSNVHMHWKHVVVLITDPIHIVHWLAQFMTQLSCACLENVVIGLFIENEDTFIDSINMLGLCIFSREVHTFSIVLVQGVYSMHQGHSNIEQVNHLSKSSQTDVLPQFGNYE